MKAIDESSSKDQKQNIFDVSINTSNKKPDQLLIPISFQSEQKQNNFLNLPMRNPMDKNQNNNQSVVYKRTYRDIFLNSNQNNNFLAQNNSQHNFNNLIFNKGPSLINEITNNEKKKRRKYKYETE